LAVVITVIVPAHNEARVIGRLLRQLVADAHPGELDIIVVPNGCTDDTAAVAASFGQPVRVVEVAGASKPAALRAGDAAAGGFPRVYVDADIELGAADVRALASALQESGVLAAGPERELALARSQPLVRWYYEVWARLPAVQSGLFGRGVIAVSDGGHARIASLPPLLSDDLAVSLAFAPSERLIVPAARAVVHPPQTIADLVRRRVRVASGVAQIEGDAAAPPSTARTSLADLAQIIRREPRLAPKVAVFAAVTVVARLQSRFGKHRGNYSVWLRDESSRG
jgi:glycosyltransferase involved in cell wall biosynthesis